jgi:hypothetical protein
MYTPESAFGMTPPGITTSTSSDISMTNNLNSLQKILRYAPQLKADVDDIVSNPITNPDEIQEVICHNGFEAVVVFF